MAAAVERRNSGREKRQQGALSLSTNTIFGVVTLGILSLTLLQVVLVQVLGVIDFGSQLHSRETARLLKTNEELTCVAWRATDSCSPDGPRKSYQLQSFFADTDLSCQSLIPNFGSGYCELVTSAGEKKKVFRRSCSRGKLAPFPFWKEFTPLFHCDQALSFMNYKSRAHAYRPVQPVLAGSLDDEPSRGIVMQIYSSVMPSVYAIIKLLRATHDCQLPIELWYVEGEIFESHKLVQHLTRHYDHVFLRVIPRREMGTTNSYLSKPYTIAYSQFDQILFLDSDNFPFQDPTYLFDSDQFRSRSAIFWKDFWSPKRKDYAITDDSLLWELLGLDAPTSLANQEMEMESGQMLIDRRKSITSLQILLFLSQTFSEWLEPLALVWGDKDLFRLAWHMAWNSFHYVEQPPSLAGKDVPFKFLGNDLVCGITMVQHDPRGDPIFFHRNIAKLSTESDLVKVWQKGASFVGANPDIEYEIEASRSFYYLHGCYHPKSSVRSSFLELDYKGSDVEDFEGQILQFAKEGFDIQDST